MDIDKCHGCRVWEERISMSLSCHLHTLRVKTDCPCLTCIVKTMCNTVCDRYNTFFANYETIKYNYR